MSKRVIIFFIGIILISPLHYVFAGLSINEIMYDLKEGSDTGREWIEVYNDSDVGVDLSTHKLFEANTSHALTVFQGDVNIEAHDYAIISSDPAKFKIDWPNFSGIIFDSSFSLANDGEFLSIKDANLNITDQHTYESASGGAGDGNSLQLINGAWKAALPTPGAVNNATVASLQSSNSGNGGLVNNNTNNDNALVQNAVAAKTETKNKVADEPKIKTKITGKLLALAGISVELSADATGVSGEKLLFGKYFWNFGDGDFREEKVIDSQKFTHTYPYEGEYVVNLEYYSNPYGDVPDASDKIAIKVMPADISISAVGDEKDFFVELSNNTAYDADISKWILGSEGKSFMVPRNTIIGSKKKIVISSKITSFSLLDKNSLKLMTPENKIAFVYSPPIVEVPVTVNPPPLLPSLGASAQVVTENKAPVQLSKANSDKSKNLVKNDPAPEALIKNLPVSDVSEPLAAAYPSLPASVIQSEIIKDDSDNTSSIIFYLISFVFIVGSAGAVYHLRQRKNILETGDDFEILD